MNNGIYENIIILLCLLALAGALAGVIAALKKEIKESMYSYKGAGLLGGAVYLVFMLGVSLRSVFSGPGLDETYSDHIVRVYATVTQRFILILLPIMIILFLAITASNISLLIHERKSPKNLLGAIMGLFLVAASVLVTFGWDYIYFNVIMKIYNAGYHWIFIFDTAVPAFFSGILGYIVCIMIGVIVFELFAVRHEPAYDKDFIIILGCSIRKDGTPYPLLKGRIDRAMKFAEDQFKATGNQAVFIPSGGKGDDEVISEAESIRNYLTEHGIDEKNILIENKSTSTAENIRFSKQIIDSVKENAKVIFSTTNYHVFRSGIYARREGLKAEGIGSKTKSYFWPNAFVRELIALFAERKKAHLIVSFLILAFSFLIGFSTFVSLGIN